MPAPSRPFPPTLLPPSASPPASAPHDRAWAPSVPVLWALVAAVALLWFVTLDARLLTHPDEGRYAEIAREMAATGDWVTPRLNGLKYFEKPPIQYWLTAAAFKNFGVHEWAARLWPALAGFLAVLAIARAGYALGGVALGAYAGLALAATVCHVFIAQIVTLDSGLSFFLALGFCAAVIAQRQETAERERRLWMWLASAALAGATLSKGLIGLVLPGGALVVYTALTRDFAVWRRLHLASCLVLYLALTAPWFVAVSREERRVLPVLFRARALPAFPSWRRRAPGPLVLLRAVLSSSGYCPGCRSSSSAPARLARRRAERARFLLAAIRALVGRGSSSSSSASPGRSCLRTSCRCSRRSRSSSAGSCCASTTGPRAHDVAAARGGNRAGVDDLRRGITS